MKKTKLLKYLELYKEHYFNKNDYTKSALINELISLLKIDTLDNLIKELEEFQIPTEKEK
jgi:hypothetical protein